ncbi:MULTISPECIES: ABC transporter substrate-binding protein [unclassified Halanaerobium]|uniref:ABC transporter substrate-binding protein n=1 Tax=unclassified Halanaerobium TaxID=2641197 RepID=UPI000DF300ED|nr:MULTISPECIES: ABC transporter substrate-binding protein [unclassified Halanaerobium]RCW47787.1 peptide/nickel transport system substrate-binding protein [Halanaerobium sp. MA284_MarDTE_T2]RCW81819.1 peptide/nickel transport system substrate-binding protein [Halanaerobium sp. DL-01]
MCNFKKISIFIIFVIMMAAFSSGVFAKTVTIATSNDALTLDAYMLSETPTNSVNHMISEPLTFFDKEMNVIPGLAESWEAVDDTTWIFNLRKGVKFHNGEEFTAEDVKFSIERAQNHPKSQMKSYVADIEEVNIIDEYTIEFKTLYPTPILARKLQSVVMYSKDYTEANTDSHMQNNPVGTGPYMVESWEKDEEMVLTFFEDYWREKPEVDRVILRPITNPATRVAALLSGEVDILIDLPVQDVENIKENGGVEVITLPDLRLIFLGMETTEGPLADVRVRKAIYHAINEDAIVEHVMNGHAYPASQFFPEFVFGYNPNIERLEYDPEKAKELLAEAGYPDGFTIQLDSSNDRYINDGQTAQAVAIQLARVGINVELNVQTKSAHFDKVLSRNTEFYLLGWSTNGDGASALEALLHTPEGKYGRFNLGDYSNKEFDRLTEEAAQTLDPEKRLKLMQQAVKIAMDDVAQIPLHFQQQIYAVQNYIDWTPRPNKYLKPYEIGFK